jgi:hypothetical protein
LCSIQGRLGEKVISQSCRIFVVLCLASGLFASSPTDGTRSTLPESVTTHNPDLISGSALSLFPVAGARQLKTNPVPFPAASGTLSSLSSVATARHAIRVLMAKVIVGLQNVNRLTVFGIFAVVLMLICYSLEARANFFVFAFGIACLMGSVYGFLQGAWPFGLIEGIWSLVAIRGWWTEGRKNKPEPLTALGNRNHSTPAVCHCHCNCRPRIRFKIANESRPVTQLAQ